MRNIYFVYFTFHLRNGEHGYYMSPFFKTRELAEKFLEELMAYPETDDRAWITHDPPCGSTPVIIEAPVEEEFSGVDDAEEYKYLIFSTRWGIGLRGDKGGDAYE